jgi:signal transduction histidine kinase
VRSADPPRAARRLSDHETRTWIASTVSRAGSLAIDLSAYRIVQEGLTNALKHTRAGRTDVTLRYAPDEVQIVVGDDDVGPAMATSPAPGSRAWARG